MYITQFDRKNFLRKKENAKVTGTGLLNAHKDTMESWDIEWSLWCEVRVEGYPITQKMKRNNLWFWAQKVKNSEYLIWNFKKIRATKNRT